ncbi:MAG: quinone-dependent dihydroorotate dehydrogenase [Verrucomicrobiota bacterium]
MPDLYPIARRVLFSLDAERAHHVTLGGMKLAEQLRILAALTGGQAAQSKTTPVKLMGLEFPNRVGLAAGLDKSGAAVDAFGSIGCGHVEVGTVTPRPQPGNAAPRLFRLREHEAIINRMGFNNPGLEGMLMNLNKSARRFRGILGINIGKNFDTPNEQAIDDYLTCFEAVYPKADYVTANLSSPNTKGLRDLQSGETCRDLLEKLQQLRAKLSETHGGKQVPIVIKIAPDLDRDAISDLAAAFNEKRVDGVITTNTTIEREVVKGHALADEAGGLSGAPLREQSLKILEWLRADLDDEIPIIASGGMMDKADAEERLAAGAELVQVYTGLVYRGPKLIREMATLA